MVTVEQLLYIVPALALAASITYYAMVLRNQIKARQTQTLMQLYQTRYSPEGVNRLWKIMNMEWTDFEDYMEKYSPSRNPDTSAITTSSWNFYDGLGMLVKKNIVDVEDVYDMLGIRILMVWFKCETLVKGLRLREPGVDYMENFEYLANEMIRIRTQKGVVLPVDRLHPTSTLLEKYT